LMMSLTVRSLSATKFLYVWKPAGNRIGLTIPKGYPV
jgi:hypothetical protein